MIEKPLTFVIVASTTSVTPYSITLTVLQKLVVVFFIFSAASNEKNKKPQSRAPLGYKLVWATIEAMVTFMV